MLDWWNNTEPFMQIAYLVLLLGIPLFLLSLSMIWRWVQREGTIERLRNARNEQQKSAFYALYHGIGKTRTIWAWIGCAAIVALAALLPASLPNGWRIGVPFIGLIALFLANNRYVAARWRCPACGENLPCLVGRSSLRPRWVDACPHCDYGRPPEAD